MRFFFLALVLGMSVTHAFAGVWETLTREQQDLLKKGKQFSVTEEVPGSAWPKIWVYQPVIATPEESIAVFWDASLHKEYIPNCLKSKITNVLSATEVWVDYLLDLPLVADEAYTVQDRLSAYDDNKSFKIAWEFVRPSANTQWAEGYALFEPMPGYQATVMVYHNFAIPKSAIADLLRGQAMKQVKETATAVANQVRLEKTDYPALLKKQLMVLREALGLER